MCTLVGVLTLNTDTNTNVVFNLDLIVIFLTKFVSYEELQ
jgi:hypothetical protein